VSVSGDRSEEYRVKFNRSAAALSLLTAAALVLAACGGTTHASSPGPSAAPVQCGGKKQLKASGATAQENAMEQFVFAYVHACPGSTLDYNADGSGAGVTDFLSNVSDLAGSGDPLNPSKGQVERAAQRCGSPAWDLPAVFEPIAVTYNVNGVNTLKLDAATLAKVFNGGITRWDDPAIKALNPGTGLPSEPIRVVFRTDQSADTSNFEQYLDAASNGAWGKGVGQLFGGGVGDGAVGDNGTSSAVQSTEGAIAYNEWSFGVGRQLSMAEIITSAGPDPVSISTDSVSKTIAGATFKGQGSDSRGLQVNTSSFYKPTEPGARSGGKGIYAGRHWPGSGRVGSIRVDSAAERVPIENRGCGERDFVISGLNQMATGYW
jgi:phosphate transport system substrate-binding protein